ncbi:MAG: hypothetical protein IRY96_05785 [Burkholderiales bacterium]|nr:hypothetical protein [Burkholderiales bacterium]
MGRAEEFVQLIKTWDAGHLADALISPDVNEIAKEAIRSELRSRGLTLDEAIAGAEARKAAAIAASRLTRSQKILVWAPTVLVVGLIAIGAYLAYWG